MADTMPEIYRPMMEGKTVKSDRCVVCGRYYPLEQHHVVWRSWGELHDDEGNRLPKATLTLCGFGNNLPYCHGLAHHRLLHFRWNVDHWEYLRTKNETKYQDTLTMDGWRPIHED